MDKDSQQLANLIGGVRQDLQLIGDKILSNQEKIMALLDDILAKVRAESDVVDSVITLLNGLNQKLNDAIANGADPDKLQQISDAISTQTGKLSQAVTQNTPAQGGASAPTPAPSPEPSAPVDTAPVVPDVPAPTPTDPAPTPEAPVPDSGPSDVPAGPPETPAGPPTTDGQ